jgi:hypothetical protein
MFTGNYSHVAGHRSLQNLIKPWEPNLFRALKEDGYHVACLANRGDTFAPTVTVSPLVLAEGATWLGIADRPLCVSLLEAGWLLTLSKEVSMTEYGFLVPEDFRPPPGPSPPEDLEADVWGRLFYRGKISDIDPMDWDEALVQSALKWLERPPKDKPWLLFLPLIFPHCPFQVASPYFEMYDRAQMPKPSKPADKVSGKSKRMPPFKC